MDVFYAPVGDLLCDTIAKLEEYQRGRAVDPEDIGVEVDPVRDELITPTYRGSKELAIVVSFMEALRLVEDFFPGEFADRWRPQLLATICHAEAVALELRALRAALVEEAARLRAVQAFEASHQTPSHQRPC